MSDGEPLSTGASDPQPPPSKTEYVVRRLRDDIREGRISPGELLKQTVIAKRYGVSATPVREALRLLEAEQTIEFAAHRGATVREMSTDEVLDFYRLRAAVEGLATELAVPRLTEAQLRGVYAIHEEIINRVEHGVHDRLSELNMELHFAIYSAGSSVVTNQARSLWTFIPPRITLWKDPHNAHALLNDHERILEAIGRKDAGMARDLVASHIMNAESMRHTTLPGG